MSAETLTFPFVEELPKAKKSAFRDAMDGIRLFRKLSNKHGGLLPVSVAANLVGLSRQRIHQLVEAGRIDSEELRNGQIYVGVDSLAEYAKAEKSLGGRPRKGE